MILGTSHRSPGINRTAEENCENLQLGDRLMKVVRLAIASNGVPYVKMRSVGSHSTPGRRGRAGSHLGSLYLHHVTHILAGEAYEHEMSSRLVSLDPHRVITSRNYLLIGRNILQFLPTKPRTQHGIIDL